MRITGLRRGYLARHPAHDLSPKAQERLRWLSAFNALREQSVSSARASQALGLARSTLDRWQRRLKGQGPTGLGDKMREPRRLRRPTWPWQLAQGRQGAAQEWHHLC